ncbi:MAG TPA: hypothetical protein GXZ47_05980 [Treponema sp.]|nr:hypothetical protein [Treponema sp.]
MNIERFFTGSFENQSFIEKSKARIFFYYSIFLLLNLGLLIFLYTVMPLSPILAKKGVMGASIIIFLVFFSMCMLRTGRLHLAVWVYALPTLLAVVGLRILNSPAAPETAFSTYIFYMPYLIVYIAVFGKRWQVVGTTAYFFISNWGIWYLVRNIEGDIGAMINTGVINSTMGILTTGIIAYSLLGIMDKYIFSLQKDAETSAGKVSRIRNAMDVAHDGLDVGSSLVAESESMESAAQLIGSGIDEIRKEVVSLTGDIDRTAEVNTGIVESTVSLTRSTDTYLSMTQQASSAVEEMTAAIESITTVSTRNRDSVESLAESIANGITTADTTARTIESLSGSSKSLQDVVEVISAISSQTNLLAMNAAIEAAHAGDSGKGFAVVADEIRRLAEETALNSQTISKGLGAFFQEITTAEIANKQMESSFKEIDSGIANTQNAFEEIISGMKELSIGTKDINKSVTDVVTASREMNNSIKSMNGMIATNSESINYVREKSSRTLSKLDGMTGGFEDILSRAGNVRKLGRQTDEVIRGLDESIRAI